MVGAKGPGCAGCAKTPHGGRTTDQTARGSEDRYEVRLDGEVIGRFRSVVAASTFMAGRHGATVHQVTPSNGQASGGV